MERYLFTVEIKYEGGLRRIEGTRAEEGKMPGSLIIYDGDSVVARFPEKVESWSREQLPGRREDQNPSGN